MSQILKSMEKALFGFNEDNQFCFLLPNLSYLYMYMSQVGLLICLIWANTELYICHCKSMTSFKIFSVWLICNKVFLHAINCVQGFTHIVDNGSAASMCFDII